VKNRRMIKKFVPSRLGWEDGETKVLPEREAEV